MGGLAESKTRDANKGEESMGVGIGEGGDERGRAAGLWRQ